MSFYISTGVTVIRLALPMVSVTSSQDSASVSPASPACTASAARSTSSASARPDANVRTMTSLMMNSPLRDGLECVVSVWCSDAVSV